MKKKRRSFYVYQIEDKDAKVVYKGCPTRDFNAYLNASDKLEEFIKFCGNAGVRQGDMLGIPIELFIKWLVIEAARTDGEKTEMLLDLRALPDYSQPRCSCGRYLSREFKKQGLNFCRTKCYEKKMLAIECQPV